jgi:hypothetical protein
MVKRITINGYKKWNDFVFSIRGTMYQCVECAEDEKFYLFRFEKTISWNYPMFEFMIDRRPHWSTLQPPHNIRINCRQLLGPNKPGQSIDELATILEISNWDYIEKTMTRLMDTLSSPI